MVEASELILAAKRRGVYRENPALADLPDWVRGFRDHQREGIESAVADLLDVDLEFVDAPTGSGKTLIGESVRRLVGGSGVYICSGKTLQDQFLKDFPYAKVLKGKSNYVPDRIPRHLRDANISCDDCDGSYCSACPYKQAKDDALRSPVAVLNTSYFLAECNGPGRFSGRDFVIADEADTLEGALMSHVSINISPFRMKKYGWKPPEKVTVAESWQEWVIEAIENAQKELSYLPEYSPELEVKTKREIKWLGNFLDRCELLEQGLESNSWIYDGKKDDLEVKFKPITVDQIGEQVLWRHGRKWLCMSASLLSSQEMAQSLGWQKDYSTVIVPSTFPVANRPVFIRSVANMGSKANSDGSQSILLMDEIDRIINAHPDEKILIHTVSYMLARQIAGHINGSYLNTTLYTPAIPSPIRKVFQYTDGQGRDRTVEAWKADSTPSIMVAPSLDRGVDLPGDLCRVQIIAKVPFPFLGDKQVSARLYGRNGKTWYAVQTVRTIVQMTGRAVRNEKDKAVCYVLDASFDDLWSKNKRLFPKWWRDAVVWKK